MNGSSDVFLKNLSSQYAGEVEFIVVSISHTAYIMKLYACNLIKLIKIESVEI